MARQLLSFEAVYREFHPRVLRYLAGFVGDADAADLAQVTMLKVSGHLPGFRGDSSLSTWIYRIATNVALDRLRERSPAGTLLQGEADDDGEALDHAIPPELHVSSAEAAAARREMSACIREFVDRLPPNYRNIVVLSDVEGFANEEIAEITGLSLDTVKIRLHRGRARLRAALQAGCTIERDDRDELACGRKPRRA